MSEEIKIAAGGTDGESGEGQNFIHQLIQADISVSLPNPTVIFTSATARR